MAYDQHPLSVLLIGKGATPEAVAEFQQMMSSCIYITTVSSSGRLVLAAFVLPESKRWWIEGLADDPQVVGLENVQLTYSNSLRISSRWSRGEAIEAAGNPPCGANCAACPAWGERCPGCAASHFCHERAAEMVTS